MASEASYTQYAADNIVKIPFPAHGYITGEATLSQEDFSNNQVGKGDLAVCLDTGTHRSFIDCTIIDRLVLRASKIQPIATRGLAGFKVLDHIVHLTFAFGQGTSLDSQMTIPVTALIADGLKAGVLIGTDAMIPSGVDLLLTKQQLIQGNRTASLTTSTCSGTEVYTFFHALTRLTSFETFQASRLTYGTFYRQLHHRPKPAAHSTARRPLPLSRSCIHTFRTIITFSTLSTTTQSTNSTLTLRGSR